jgi:tryptophan-rich sensory protein
LKSRTWITYLWNILLAEAVGALAGWLTRESTRIYATTLQKPPLSPPGFLFPIIWVVLFALMGIGAARIRLAIPSTRRTQSLAVYWAQLIVNFFWSLIFFNLRAYGPAFLWLLLLWVLVLRMILAFRRINRLSAWLQIPYLLWVTFAAYLNLGVWLLN